MNPAFQVFGLEYALFRGLNGFVVFFRIFLAAIIAFLIVNANANPRSQRFFENCYPIANSRANIVILTSPDASKGEIKAADFLAKTLKKAVPLGEIRVGIKERNDAFTIELLPASKDRNFLNFGAEFKFETFGKKIRIVYPYPEAVWTAVGEFLRRKCGIKFFAPSELGANIPSIKYLRLKTGKEVFTPSYAGRTLHLGANSEEWGKINGADSGYFISPHFMNKIFDKKTAEKHPDWLGMGQNGKRMKYSLGTQADLFNEDFRNYVHSRVEQFFANGNPLISLGLPDSGRFDCAGKTLAKIRGYSSRHYADYSDVVFDFTNDIARRLSKKHPQKLVFQMAYLYSENPPSFPLESNIAVYIATDRGNWFSDAEKREDLRLFKAWSNSGARTFGLYDYLYGSPYFIPRETTKHSAEALKKAEELGAKLYMGEAFPVWAYDAHKLWIIFRLLKDSSLSEKDLEDEFFSEYYGKSEKPIRAFFKTAENSWNSRMDKPLWLRLYKRESQSELFNSEDILKMERALKDAEKSANSDIVSSRVKEIRLVFEISKSAIELHFLKKKLWEIYPVSHENSPKILKLMEKIRDSHSLLELNIQKYLQNSKYPKSNFSIWNSIDFTDPSEMRAAELAELGDTKVSGELEKIFGKNFSCALKKSGKNMLKNPSFERGFEDWFVSKPISERNRIGVASDSYSGKFAVKLTSLSHTGISQNAKVEPGTNYVFGARFKGKIEIGNTFYIRLSFFNKNGALISAKRLQLPNLNFKNFEKAEIFAKAPPDSYFAECAIIAVNCHPDEFILADDAYMFQLVPIEN